MKKLLVALFASAFAVTAFAQAPQKADPATPPAKSAKVEKETDKKGATKAPRKVKSTKKAEDKKDSKEAIKKDSKETVKK